MKDNGIVQGSKDWARPIVIIGDNVYVHTNIEKIEMFDENDNDLSYYQYEEKQYTKDEYFEVLVNKVIELENKLGGTE